MSLPLPYFRCPWQVPRLPQFLSDLFTNQRFPCPLPLGFNILLEQLTEIKETLMFTKLVKDVRKDTDKQPDEAR